MWPVSACEKFLPWLISRFCLQRVIAEDALIVNPFALYASIALVMDA